MILLFWFKAVIQFYVPLLGEPILEHKILLISVQIWPRINYKASWWITPVSLDVLQASLSNVVELFNVEKSKILPSQIISGFSILTKYPAQWIHDFKYRFSQAKQQNTRLYFFYVLLLMIGANVRCGCSPSTLLLIGARFLFSPWKMFCASLKPRQSAW